jgi:hypothetical protein
LSEDVAGWIRGADVALTFNFDVLIGGPNTRLGNRNDVLVQKQYVQEIMTGPGGLANRRSQTGGAQ